jgi:hypothetical protein
LVRVFEKNPDLYGKYVRKNIPVSVMQPEEAISTRSLGYYDTGHPHIVVNPIQRKANVVSLLKHEIAHAYQRKIKDKDFYDRFVDVLGKEERARAAEDKISAREYSRRTGDIEHPSVLQRVDKVNEGGRMTKFKEENNKTNQKRISGEASAYLKAKEDLQSKEQMQKILNIFKTQQALQELPLQEYIPDTMTKEEKVEAANLPEK